MKLKRGIIIILSLAAAFALVGCKESGLDSISQNLTEYKIDAVYEGGDTVNVNMTVDYVNNYDVCLSELKFHLYPAAFREGAQYKPVTEAEMPHAYPSGISYGGIEISSVVRSGTQLDVSIDGLDEDILTVPFDKELKPTSRIKVEVAFTLKLPTVRHRFGKYGSTVNLGNWYPIACVYSSGSFITEPYYSTGDPFFSEPSNYKVSIKTPSELSVACTGTSTVTGGDGFTTVNSEAKAVRDFAAVIGEFSTVADVSGDTEIKYYYATDSDPAASLKAAKDSLDTFSAHYGAYPYKSYTVVETPFLQGGMEYPQLVFISDALSPEIYRDAIIHETAHQWFYGIVGSDQIKHAWLDEALAEYSTTLFYEWNPDYNVSVDKRIADALSSFILYCELYKEDGKGDTSMNRALPEYANNMEYTYMTYVKGSLMLDTVRRTIGGNVFEKAIKNYVADNFIKTAEPDNLIAAFENASGKELKPLFESWIQGKVLLYVK